MTDLESVYSWRNNLQLLGYCSTLPHLVKRLRFPFPYPSHLLRTRTYIYMLNSNTLIAHLH